MTYILPQLDLDIDNIDNLKSSIFTRIEAAKTSTYRVDSAKTILDIDSGATSSLTASALRVSPTMFT